MFSNEREMAQALLDGRRFKDQYDNTYFWDSSLIDGCCTPFRLSRKNKDGKWEDINNFSVHGQLTEIFDHPDLQMDDPVLVCNSWEDKLNGRWFARHFSGWSHDGKMQCFDGGQTSHSTDSPRSPWKYWKILVGEHKGKNNFKTNKEK